MEAQRARKATHSEKPRTFLTRKELAQFRVMLLEKRRSLLGDMTGLEAEIHRGAHGAANVLSLSLVTHLADVATDCHGMEMTAGLLASECELLREIDEALDRIDDGTYGICLATGQPIGKARLKARPWAKYCIEYARSLERRLGPIPGYARADTEGSRIAAGAAREEPDIAEAGAWQLSRRDL